MDSFVGVSNEGLIPPPATACWGVGGLSSSRSG